MEKPAQGSRRLLSVYRWTLTFLRPQIVRLGLIIFAGLIISLSELAAPTFVQHIIDSVVPKHDYLQLGNTLILITGLAIVMITTGAVRNLWQRELVQRACRDSQLASFEHLRDLGVAYFEASSVGQTLSLMNTQMQAVEKIYQHYLPLMIQHTMFASVSAFFMLQVSVRLTLFTIPCFIIYYLFGPWLEKKANLYGRSSAQSVRALQQKLYESLAAMPDIRAFSCEDWDMKRFRQVGDSVRENHMRSVLFAYLRGTFRRLSYYLGAIGVFLYGAAMVQQQALTTGQLVAFILYYFSGMHILTSIVTAITEQRLLLHQIEPLYEFMQQRPAVVESPTPVMVPTVRGEIRFADVHFGYGENVDVLEGFNLHIRVGERVALVGKSGGGKSTLLKLIGRFYDPRLGAVYLDGVNLNDMALSQLRESIGFVFQETFLFNMSIKENVRFGNPGATDADVIEAAKLAYCHDFIMQLAQGYETLVGERGVKLSGGQKQRIAIARMLIKNPRIVLLDEATAALDTISEREVKAALDRLLTGRTVIAIAHRLSTIKDFDRIVCVDHGQNLEMGTWQELIDQRGYFYRLAAALTPYEEAAV